MRVVIEVPGYSADSGVRFDWDVGSEIEVRSYGSETVIEANRAGLRSLARHCLTLAQEEVPPGLHLHLDEGSGLEPGSSSLVIERA